jgi:hypothetical protein
MLMVNADTNACQQLKMRWGYLADAALSVLDLLLSRDDAITQSHVVTHPVLRRKRHRHPDPRNVPLAVGRADRHGLVDVQFVRLAIGISHGHGDEQRQLRRAEGIGRPAKHIQVDAENNVLVGHRCPGSSFAVQPAWLIQRTADGPAQAAHHRSAGKFTVTLGIGKTTFGTAPVTVVALHHHIASKLTRGQHIRRTSELPATLPGEKMHTAW